MSFIALQRVAVRMLLDPRFAKAVFDSPDESLSSALLSAEERTWLLQSERRAWRLDPMRRTRTLQALLEEYPVSAALVLTADKDARRLDAFFSSPDMHQAIQSRGRLSAAFGAYLAALRLRGLHAAAHIEAGLAYSRCPSPPVEATAELLQLASGHRVLALPEGSLESYLLILESLTAQANHERLSLIELLLSDRLHTPAWPHHQGEATSYVLIEPSEADLDSERSHQLWPAPARRGVHPDERPLRGGRCARG